MHFASDSRIGEGHDAADPRFQTAQLQQFRHLGKRRRRDPHDEIRPTISLTGTFGRTKRANLLLVKGEILVENSEPDMREGEACLLSALRLAEEQGLLSLELRSGISLAKLLGESRLSSQRH